MSTATSAPARSSAGLSASVLVAFGLVYFFWGSTYTAIRIAGQHLPPPLIGACRTLLSTVILLVICLVRRTSLRLPASAIWRLALVGVLFMSVNNVLLTWAETMVPSGLAALIVATTPMMVAAIEAFLPGGELLTRRGWAGLLLGTLGMVALVSPSFRFRSPTPAGGTHLFAYAILLVAALAFAIGTVLGRRFALKVDIFVATGYQLGAASLVNSAIALAAGNLHHARWTRSGILSVAYLGVFGSVVGLTCLTYLLQHVPVTKVATYAFVNPVVAVLLGVQLLGERLDTPELLGMAIIVAAVALVIFSRVKRGDPDATAALADPLKPR